MGLLQEGVVCGAVTKTDMTRKLTLDGVTKAYSVYKIRLDQLYYNEQNDRIATWLNEYASEHGPLPDGDRETYNAVLEDFIVKSNPEAIRKTQKNIELVDQREAGVVLNDGCIIDGNRRFTCLRKLAKNSERFNSFEAVILERDMRDSAKQIKMLELQIQHGEESRVEYSPVDRLVGVYQDIEENHLLTVEEYARSANEPLAEVKKRLEIAKLMVEFLDFINAPKQYYIVRDLDLAAVLEELFGVLRKCRTEDEKENIKSCAFANLIMRPAGDQTRFIRNMKSIVASDYADSFVDEQLELAAKVVDTLPPRGKVNGKVIRDVIRANDELKDELERSMEKAVTKTKRSETRNRPIQLVEKATSLLEDIDVNIFLKMSDSELQRLSRQIRLLEQTLADIKENLND